MAGSLKDQLLKTGLANNKQARRAEHEKRQTRTRRDKGEAVEDVTELARASREAQAERSRALNAEREEQARARALVAQVAQLVSQHRLERAGGESAYQFVDERKVRKLYVKADMVEPLSRGRLAIVRQGEGYEVVVADIARRLRERLPEVVVLLHEGKEAMPAEDDPYADYPIPDDLMW